MMTFKRFFSMFGLATALAVAGCGGGSGGGSGTNALGSGAGTGTGGTGTGTGTTTAASITLKVAPTTVTATNPGTVTATVLNGSGVAIPGQVVAFATRSGLGALSPTSALTDSNGVATVTLKPTAASTAGADVVIASTTVGTTVVSAQTGFQLTATNVAISAFTSDLGTASLSPYGQAVLTVTLSSAAIGTPVTVNVSSACVTAGQATLTPATATTSTGTATFTFRDNGCGANVTDTLQASIAGSGSTGSLTLNLVAPTVSSISFVSASPSTIYLRGSGYTENSVITFQVRDAAGNGVRGQSVQLNPTTLAGGILVNNVGDINSFPLTSTSDSNGNVLVRVNSGSVPTPVRVRASITVAGNVISTVSSTLSIAVGLPSQLNFSMAQGQLNIEGYNRDGTTNTYAIIASDRLGNPVPDGTAINFVSEGGQIQSSVFTVGVNGLSSATARFQSSQPRPPDGRITVLAYALGEKSFIDENGDNLFTAADTHQWFQDLGYPYIDTLYNGVFASSALNQFFVQTPNGSLACNSDLGTSSLPLNLIGDVSIPSMPNTCSGSWGSANVGTAYVRRAVETVLSTSAAFPMWGVAPPFGAASCPVPFSLLRPNNPPALPAYNSAGMPQMQTYYAFGTSGLVGMPTPGVLSFYASDANPNAFNPVAAGSTISVSATTGLTVSVAGGSPVPSSSAPTAVAVNYSFAVGATSGTITVTITSPSGLATSFSQPITTLGTAPGLSCP